MARADCWESKGCYDKAEKDYDEEIRLDPQDREAIMSRAWLNQLKGEYDAAIRDCTEAIRLDPTRLDGWGMRGDIWQAKGCHDAAIRDYTEVIRLDPNQWAILASRGNAWLDKKEYDKAITDFNSALCLSPGNTRIILDRSVAWSRKKEYANAAVDIDDAIQLEPIIPDAYATKAWLLATCPDKKFRDGKEAVELAKKACESAGGNFPRHWETLAAAYAEAGQFDQAVKWQQMVLADKEAAKAGGQNLRKRLKLYQEQKPYRDEGE